MSRLRNTLACSLLLFGVWGGPIWALPNASLGALALEIAPVRDELDGAEARGAIPARATLDRAASAMRAWRARLDAIAPTNSRGTPPADRGDALFLRAQLTHVARMVAFYRASPQARDDAQRLGHAGYENLLRDELLLPYSASDIERMARTQLTESVARIAWLETRAPLAHTVIAQERAVAPNIDVIGFLTSHDLITIPAGVTLPRDEPGAGAVLSALQRALAARSADPVRQNARCTLFEQGWEAYSAQMLGAVGAYGEDPTSRMRLALIERADAAAALADVKLAAGDWTFLQAVEFLVRETGATDAQAQSAAAGIALHPGNAIAPVAGRILIENLLAEYRKRMSSRGSLRDFHDRLLSYGSVPFAVLGPELLADLPKL